MITELETDPYKLRRKSQNIWIGVIILIGLVSTLINPIRSLISIRKITNHPLYVMHYYGGYNLFKSLKFDESLSDVLDIPVMLPGSSSSLAALNQEGYAILGRNLGRRYQTPALLLFTNPRNGYASAAMIPLSQLGIHGNNLSTIDYIKLLLSPFFVVDGMNEYGLAASAIYVPCRIGVDDATKPDLNISQAIRIILDQAKNIDEAIELIRQHELTFKHACGHHHLMDAFGNAAIIEYIGGKTIISRNEEPWQIATNFLVAEEGFEVEKAPCWRYIHAYEHLHTENGKEDTPGIMSILEDIAVGNIWSVAYNLSLGDIDLVLGHEFNRRYTFHLDLRIQYLPHFSPRKVTRLP